MENGFVGILEHIPDKYRCYILFLQSEIELKSPAEEYIMRHFWDVANSVSEDVIFTGIVSGKGLMEARRIFGIKDKTKAAITILDTHPGLWKKSEDPIVTIFLNKFKKEYEVLEFLHLLVSISKKNNFIGKLKRKETFGKVKEFLSYIPKVRYLIP